MPLSELINNTNNAVITLDIAINTKENPSNPMVEYSVLSQMINDYAQKNIIMSVKLYCATSDEYNKICKAVEENREPIYQYVRNAIVVNSYASDESDEAKMMTQDEFIRERS